MNISFFFLFFTTHKRNDFIIFSRNRWVRFTFPDSAHPFQVGTNRAGGSINILFRVVSKRRGGVAACRAITKNTRRGSTMWIRHTDPRRGELAVKPRSKINLTKHLAPPVFLFRAPFEILIPFGAVHLGIVSHATTRAHLFHTHLVVCDIGHKDVSLNLRIYYWTRFA